MADQPRLHFVRGQHNTLDVAVGEGEIRKQARQFLRSSRSSDSE